MGMWEGYTFVNLAIRSDVTAGLNGAPVSKNNRAYNLKSIL